MYWQFKLIRIHRSQRNVLIANILTGNINKSFMIEI